MCTSRGGDRRFRSSWNQVILRRLFISLCLFFLSSISISRFTGELWFRMNIISNKCWIVIRDAYDNNRLVIRWHFIVHIIHVNIVASFTFYSIWWWDNIPYMQHCISVEECPLLWHLNNIFHHHKLLVTWLLAWNSDESFTILCILYSCFPFHIVAIKKMFQQSRKQRWKMHSMVIIPSCQPNLALCSSAGDKRLCIIWTKMTRCNPIWTIPV